MKSNIEYNILRFLLSNAHLNQLSLFTATILHTNAFFISKRICCCRNREKVGSPIAVKTPAFLQTGKYLKKSCSKHFSVIFKNTRSCAILAPICFRFSSFPLGTENTTSALGVGKYVSLQRFFQWVYTHAPPQRVLIIESELLFF